MTSMSNRLNPLKLELPTRLESEKLLLRSYASSDAPTLAQALSSNRERLAEEFPARFGSASVEHDAEQFIFRSLQRWKIRRDFYFGIWEKQSRHFAGEIALLEVDWSVPKAAVSYFVTSESEGRGLVTHALRLLLPFSFEVLGLRKLDIRCDVHNLRSQRVAERCGFKIEGVLRNDHTKPDGALVSIVHYGMTPADYRGLNAKPPGSGGST